jgi:hypothetical protein
LRIGFEIVSFGFRNQFFPLKHFFNGKLANKLSLTKKNVKISVTKGFLWIDLFSCSKGANFIFLILSNHNMQLNSKKIDVLKGISILLVFAYHALLTLQSQQRTHPSFSFSSGILDVSSLSKKDWLIFISPYSYGFAGVQFFLLISGFLIHLSFLNSRKGFSVKVSFWKRFW